ncbi:hypothetical protein [Sphingobacterium sp. N143]|uniref:hypothetical protein n=1 Tax=Sphingobacterium sp. N143 TaxID=2746727 RepID=UPI00257704E9|nr:hypothetical protein [Sphingobacterium sp. N143]
MYMIICYAIDHKHYTRPALLSAKNGQTGRGHVLFTIGRRKLAPDLKICLPGADIGAE